MSPRPSKREKLLDAALALVAEHGYSALTLDAVGAAVGVSKGGVLYHFPTKDALVVALIEQLGDGFDAAQEAALAQDPRMPGAATPVACGSSSCICRCTTCGSLKTCAMSLIGPQGTPAGVSSDNQWADECCRKIASRRSISSAR